MDWEPSKGEYFLQWGSGIVQKKVWGRGGGVWNACRRTAWLKKTVPEGRKVAFKESFLEERGGWLGEKTGVRLRISITVEKVDEEALTGRIEPNQPPHRCSY